MQMSGERSPLCSRWRQQGYQLRAAATLHFMLPLAAHCRCQQLQLIVPRPIARWLKVLSQPWEGDVTMVLPSAYSQIKKAITNPTSADLQEACLQASDWLQAFGWHRGHRQPPGDASCVHVAMLGCRQLAEWQRQHRALLVQCSGPAECGRGLLTAADQSSGRCCKGQKHQSGGPHVQGEQPP